MICVGTIIDNLGGNASVARSLHLRPSAVSEMKRRGSIPPRYWMGLIHLAHEKGVGGVSAESLLAAHSDHTRTEVAS